jgi:hypothetical protein
LSSRQPITEKQTLNGMKPVKVLVIILKLFLSTMSLLIIFASIVGRTE